MGCPDNYAGLQAREEAVERARAAKEENDLSWSEFLERAADYIHYENAEREELTET